MESREGPEVVDISASPMKQTPMRDIPPLGPKRLFRNDDGVEAEGVGEIGVAGEQEGVVEIGVAGEQEGVGEIGVAGEKEGVVEIGVAGKQEGVVEIGVAGEQGADGEGLEVGVGGNPEEAAEGDLEVQVGVQDVASDGGGENLEGNRVVADEAAGAVGGLQQQVHEPDLLVQQLESVTLGAPRKSMKPIAKTGITTTKRIARLAKTRPGATITATRVFLEDGLGERIRIATEKDKCWSQQLEELDLVVEDLVFRFTTVKSLRMKSEEGEEDQDNLLADLQESVDKIQALRLKIKTKKDKMKAKLQKKSAKRAVCCINCLQK